MTTGKSRNYFITFRRMIGYVNMKKIVYFSRRMNSNHGGGEECDLYLIELLREVNCEVNVISEKRGRVVNQQRKRNLINKTREELLEIGFYIKNWKEFFAGDQFIFTGRSLVVSFFSLFLRARLIYNIHGSTNSVALFLFRLSGSKLIFWGISYRMNNSPSLSNFLDGIYPSSQHIRVALKRYKRDLGCENIIQLSRSSNISLLWVGRLEPIKNPLLFLRVLDELEKENIEFDSRIIGDGSLMKDILFQIKNKSIEGAKNNIKVCGQVANNMMGSAYANSNILVITSKTESFSIVIVEALLAGLIVVSRPIKELISGPLASYIHFSRKDTAESIASAIQFAAQRKPEDRGDFRRALIEKYNHQRVELLKCLR